MCFRRIIQFPIIFSTWIFDNLYIKILFSSRPGLAFMLHFNELFCIIFRSLRFSLETITWVSNDFTFHAPNYKILHAMRLFLNKIYPLIFKEIYLNHFERARNYGAYLIDQVPSPLNSDHSCALCILEANNVTDPKSYRVSVKQSLFHLLII